VGFLRNISLKYKELQIESLSYNIIPTAPEGTFEFAFVKMEEGKLLRVIGLIITIVPINEDQNIKKEHFKVDFFDVNKLRILV
jgi:hypothetical protein